MLAELLTDLFIWICVPAFYPLTILVATVDFMTKHLNIAESLENTVLDYLTGIINGMPAEAYTLPLPLLFEIHVGLYKKNKLLILHKEWSSIDQFQRILNWKMKRFAVIVGAI